jgi:hypothetical protein
VVGKVGWLGALVALSGGEPFEVEQRLHALERKELVRRERRSAFAGERQYGFRHVLVRDVAYGQLPRAARADRHRRVAEWLEELSPDRAEGRAELLAHHWQAALEYATAAGQDGAGLALGARTAAQRRRPGPGAQRLRRRRPLVHGGAPGVAGGRPGAAAAAATAGAGALARRPGRRGRAR